MLVLRHHATAREGGDVGSGAVDCWLAGSLTHKNTHMYENVMYVEFQDFPMLATRATTVTHTCTCMYTCMYMTIQVYMYESLHAIKYMYSHKTQVTPYVECKIAIRVNFKGAPNRPYVIGWGAQSKQATASQTNYWNLLIHDCTYAHSPHRVVQSTVLLIYK